MKSILKNHHLLSWTLLAVNFALGLLTLYWGSFVDEADNLVVGDLLRQGVSLYGGVFSHHFPFPYYWMALVIALFGKSIFAARFSLLIFQIAAFAVAMKLSDKPLLVGAAALLWGIVRPFYDGHMVLYTSFAGVSLFVILLTVLPILEGTVIPNRKHWLTIGLFSLIAFLSGPLAIYAILVTLAFLFFKKPEWALKPGLVITGGLALFFGALLLTNSLQVFWQNAILFNAQVYNKYGDANPVRLTDFFSQAFTGLGLPFGHWFDLNPFKPIQIGYAQIDAWFFTGLLYRLGIIVAALFLILRRKFSAGAYLYLFAAATLLIAKVHFRSQAFILVAMTALAAVALDGIRWGEGREGSTAAGRTLRVIVAMIVAVMTLWLGLRLVGQMILDRQDLTYAANFQKYEREADRLGRLSCDLPDISLAYYPEGVYSYWFTNFQPASKYIFMWPWVAEVGQDEMIRELDGRQFVIVIVNEETVWDNYATTDYLRPLLDYLEANYHKVSKDTYISPALFESCPQ